MKRYDCTGYDFEEYESDEGEYCRWSDVEQLKRDFDEQMTKLTVMNGKLAVERDALAKFAEARRVQINELMDEREIEEDKKAALRQEVVDLRSELSIVTLNRNSLRKEADQLRELSQNRAVQIDRLMDERDELKRTPRTTGECSGCLELRARIADMELVQNGLEPLTESELEEALNEVNHD